MNPIHYATDWNGKYYKIDWNKKTYTLISEATFYKEGPYKKSDLANLSKSVYPTQGNDYLLLKKDGQSFPVDYKLVPLVKLLWKKGFATQGWNQPARGEFDHGFVSFDHYIKNGESSLCAIEKLLGDLPYKVINHFNDFLDTGDLEKRIQKEEALYKKGFFVLSVESNFVAIGFSEHLMEKLYKKLNLPLNEKRLPGAGILYELDIKRLHKSK